MWVWDLWGDDALEDELCDPVPCGHLEILVAQVEQDHTDVAPVVGVDDACPDVDALLECKPGPAEVE